LLLSKRMKDRLVPDSTEQIHGGYSNTRGDIVLFGDKSAYRLNFKNQTAQERPRLNASAQAVYDATPAGDPFNFCNKAFQRLSLAQILEICSSGAFRIIPKI
jgi:hypothetical protein